MIYLETVRPMIEAAFNRTKVTCFAYGQTGSGKTYTMMGPGTNALQMGTPGLYLLAAFDIFSYLEHPSYNHLEIWASFYEIYCGKLYDLLNDRNLLTAREDGKQNICIVGLTEKNVSNLQQMMNLIEYGLKARTVGVTGANSDSSRSHGIVQICIKEPNGSLHGKISFIDLAGSERAADTIDTNKQTRIDGAEINKSLLALKECIRALDQDKKHTPFRGSKLTLVLRDSFMGNCKTLMIANISPCLTCSEHTLNTLRYADRVKELRSGKESINFEDKVQQKEKDPQEMLANLLMMPRQHNKSIKYTVDKNLNPIKPMNNNSSKQGSTQNLNIVNVNVSNMNYNKRNENNINNPHLLNSSGTSNTKSNNSGISPILADKENNKNIENELFNLLNRRGNVQGKANMVSSNFNNNDNNLMKSKSGVTTNTTNSNAHQFLNEYCSFNQQRNSIASIQSKNTLNMIDEEELQKLSEKHDILIKTILAEEEVIQNEHKKHVDEKVELVKMVR